MVKFGQKGSVLFSIYGSIGESCIGLVEDRIYPEDSGSLTKLVGCSYLYKGYPAGVVMKQLDTSGDSSWMMIKIFENKLLIFLAILVYIFFRKFAKRYFIKVCENYFRVAYYPLKKQDFVPKEYEWCVSVRELYRQSEELLKEVKDEQLRNIFSKFRDIIFLKVEMDTAYRPTMQDILPEFNIDDLKKNPVVEIQRIFKIIEQREVRNRQKKKYENMEKKVLFLLRFSRKIRRLVVKFLSGLDYNKIKMDEADWYFTLLHQDYLFGGKSSEDREAEKKMIDIEKKHFIPKLKLVREPSPHFEIVQSYD